MQRETNNCSDEDEETEERLALTSPISVCNIVFFTVARTTNVRKFWGAVYEAGLSVLKGHGFNSLFGVLYTIIIFVHPFLCLIGFKYHNS